MGSQAGATGIRTAGRLPTALAVLTLGAVLALSACSDGPAPTAESPAPTLPTTTTVTTPTPTTTPSPSAREQARQLARQGLRSPLDVRYAIRPRAPASPRGQVRVRLEGSRYRVDVARGQTTASLFTAPRGLVSCQTSPRGRSCFLVSTSRTRPPALFDPGVQRIFSRTLRRLAASGASTTVVRSGTVRTARYGPAQCFTVRGQRVDAGRYCLLEGGRFAGVPARVQFRSGALKVLSIDRGLSDSVFRPVVRPTPLPG